MTNCLLLENMCKEIMLFTLLFIATTIPNTTDSFNNPLQFQCRINMTSRCFNHQITKWNYKNVGKKLKQWIKSVVIEWKYEEYTIRGSHCKVFYKLENRVFEKYAPGAFDPDVIMIGKIDNSLNASREDKHMCIDNMIKPKLYGPVWADLNNRHEWIIDENSKGISVRLSEDAILGNGLYYGSLSGDDIKLGY